jgi:hypothetical protein
MSQSQALWSISRGEALSMKIGPGARELSVTEGRVWLTQAGSLDDVWLEPGQSVALASGSRVVIEGWPEAQFQLLVPPAACAAYQQRRPAATASAAASWGKTPASSSGLAAA